ncbi:MAG: DUF4115 domain-containing protein [Acidobacteria bacterium]|nr:DUF4115 domain-containing protein [Acidobacteriota bacterium]
MDIDADEHPGDSHARLKTEMWDYRKDLAAAQSPGLGFIAAAAAESQTRMVSLGQKLKDARLKQGKQLREIADELRIGSRYLEAIETEDWDQLPGGFFNRSFIRQYAQALGFDPVAIENEFGAIVKREPVFDLEAISAAHSPQNRRSEEKKLISVEPLRAPRNPWFDSRTGMALAALVLLVAGGGALSLFWDKQFGAQSMGQAPAAQIPAQSIPKTAPEPAKSEPSTPEPVPVVPTVTTDQDGNISLNIEATEKTWIEVAADGKRIFAGILEPGETKTISSAQRTRMVVGNAGGIAVRNRGRDIGPIGPRGQVRTVNITADGVEISAPPKKETI